MSSESLTEALFWQRSVSIVVSVVDERHLRNCVTAALDDSGCAEMR